jgi:hypothetical protein
MTKPKFSSRLQVWVTDETADAFEALAHGGLLAVSDHIRIALSNHLRQLGITTPSQPIQNGKLPEQTHGL